MCSSAARGLLKADAVHEPALDQHLPYLVEFQPTTARELKRGGDRDVLAVRRARHSEYPREVEDLIGTAAVSRGDSSDKATPPPNDHLGYGPLR